MPYEPYFYFTVSASQFWFLLGLLLGLGIGSIPARRKTNEPHS